MWRTANHRVNGQKFHPEGEGVLFMLVLLTFVASRLLSSDFVYSVRFTK